MYRCDAHRAVAPLEKACYNNTLVLGEIAEDGTKSDLILRAGCLKIAPGQSQELGNGYSIVSSNHAIARRHTFAMVRANKESSPLVLQEWAALDWQIDEIFRDDLFNFSLGLFS